MSEHREYLNVYKYMTKIIDIKTDFEIFESLTDTEKNSDDGKELLGDIDSGLILKIRELHSVISSEVVYSLSKFSSIRKKRMTDSGLNKLDGLIDALLDELIEEEGRPYIDEIFMHGIQDLTTLFKLRPEDLA